MKTKPRDVTIVVAAHKDYPMPSDSIYLPLQVGSYDKEKIEAFAQDSSGDNISQKNSYYCELTGLYWAWKNCDSNYIGLVHYRRHFSSSTKIKSNHNREQKLKNVISEKEVRDCLKNTDIILPKKRNYYIENLYSHYKNTMHIEPLDLTRTIIAEKYPDYLKEFDNLKKRSSAHMFNMVIMKKEILDEYCEWLFDILFSLEAKIPDYIDVTKYSVFHKRFYGRISELLLDVWLNTKGYNYRELPVINIENVNWVKKGSRFLEAKFLGRKYDKSF
ncbi:DUF4422 domain-containing protein [Candidatus Saccharibacteria bacterium]|nr:DUF4422 domain-containing protein [Candidatus Saccharibacteria bacterium]